MKPILIIDSNQNFRRLLTQCLKREGYSIRQASNLNEAKKLLLDANPLVVVSSLMLPDGNGLEFLDYVCEKAPDIPAIAFSDYRQDILEASALRHGATRYFCRSEIDRMKETIMDFANQSLPELERPFLHRLQD